MTRTVPSNIFGALNDSFIIPVVFVQLEFDSGTLYLHTDLGTIVTTDTSPNKTWLGVGDLGEVGAIEERNDLSPTSVTLLLSGLDSTISDEALNQNYFERPATIYLSLRNTVTGDLLDPPFEIYAGFMENMEVTSGSGKSAIKLTLESELIEFDRSQLLYYSNEQQQDEFTGDVFFEFLAEMVNKQVEWGNAGRPLSPNNGGRSYNSRGSGGGSTPRGQGHV